MITTWTDTVEGRAVVVVEHPDGGCTVIADCGELLHAVARLSGPARRSMRYSMANKAGAAKRKRGAS